MDSNQIPEGTVTVLFSDLVESTALNQTLGDDGAREVARQIETMARGLIDSHRGILIKEMGDGVMAAFPSARRAVACAREMQVEMRRLQRGGLGDAAAMRIGLHTGEVIAEDGDIHGETVIIASRIEGLAPPNGVLVSDTVHGVLGTARDELVDQGESNLKGIDAPWRLWLLPVADDADTDALADTELTPYVGRAADRERLRTMVEDAASGRGGIVLLGGEAGSGKSRLVREMAIEAQRHSMAVRVGHCLDMESPPSYQPVIDQLEHAARGLTPEAFRDALGINAPEIARLMPVLRQRYDDIPDPPDLSPDQERRYMLHGVGEFIERTSTAQPVVLVYEDMHWADESTMMLIRHLAPLVAELPLLIVGTYRSNELDPDRPLATNLPPLRRDHGAVDLLLQPLDRSEVAAVIEARAGQVPPDDLLQLIYTESDGNPFFVEEVYKHLRDAGKLFDEDGGWKSDIAVGEREVPRNILLVIGRRLDQLDASIRRDLGIAAVVGRRFDFDLLSTVSGTDEDDLLDALETAERMNLIAEDEEETGYTFVHEQIRQALVGELSLARRQRTHLKVAEALEQRPNQSAVAIAHHLDHAGTAAPRDHTAAMLMRAAKEAIETLAFENALRHLDRAERYVDADHHVIDSLQAQALRGAGRMQDALDTLAAALSRTGLEDEVATNLRFQRTKLRLDQYQAVDALDDIGVVLEARRASGDVAGETEALLALGRAHYIMSLDDPDAAFASRDAYEQAHTLARENADARSMILALLPTSWFTDYWVDYAETADSNIAEAALLAANLGDADLVLDARSAQLKLIGMSGPLDESKLLGEDLEARRDPLRLNAHLFWFMWRTYSAAEYELTVTTCDRGIGLADILGTLPVQYGSIKALALTELGRYDEVEGALDQEVTDDEHPFGQAMAAFARASYLARLEAWGPAAEALVEAIGRAIDMQRVWMQHALKNAGGVVVARSLQHGGPPMADLEAAIDRLDLPYETRVKAEIDLAQGNAPAAIERLQGRPAQKEDLAGLGGLRESEVLAAALLANGELDAAEAAARRGITFADERGAQTSAFRLRCILGDISAAQGDTVGAAATRMEAGQRLDTLAERIADPETRERFTKQPLAQHL